MGRPRKTAIEKAARLPRKYRPSQRIASWSLDWSSALGIQVESELLALATHLGGWEHLSRQRQILLERVVFLYLWVTRYENALLEGKKPLPFDHGAYFNKVNTMHGHLKTLGLDRRLRTVDSLQSYLAKAAAP